MQKIENEQWLKGYYSRLWSLDPPTFLHRSTPLDD